jgi:hypothetical protein
LLSHSVRSYQNIQLFLALLYSNVEQLSVKVPEALEILPNHRKYLLTVRDGTCSDPKENAKLRPILDPNQ